MSSTFFCINNTSRVLVIVDNVRIECDTVDEAMVLYKSVGHIDDSAFGSMRVMVPGQIDQQVNGSIATVLVTDLTKKVNADYIKKHTDRSGYRYWISKKTDDSRRAT